MLVGREINLKSHLNAWHGVGAMVAIACLTMSMLRIWKAILNTVQEERLIMCWFCGLNACEDVRLSKCLT